MLGSLLCGVAISSNMFIIGRAVAGAGASGIFSGCLSIIAVVIPLSKRALYNGILGSLFGVATVAGPLIGGVLTTKASWRWCFYMNMPVGAITVASLILLFKPPERESQSQLTMCEKIWKIDIIGCCMFIPSIVMVLLALQWGGNKHAWRSATIIGLFCGFALLITMFFVWEHYKGDGAMIPFSVLVDRSVILSCLYGFLVFSAFILGVYYMPVYFQVIKGASPLRSGVLLLPSVCSQIFASAVSGLIGEYSSLLVRRSTKDGEIYQSIAQATTTLGSSSALPVSLSRQGSSLPSRSQPLTANGFRTRLFRALVVESRYKWLFLQCKPPSRPGRT
jgi:MFS family permease